MSFNQKLFSASQVRQLDSLVIENTGISDTSLMKRAGKVAFEAVLVHWPEAVALEVFCGGGNNGGDGYVVAALAAQRGIQVCIWQLTNKLDGAAKAAYNYAQQEDVVIKLFDKDECKQVLKDAAKQTIIIDALLGIGFDGRKLKPEYLEAIELINSSQLPILSVDIPSGVSADNGSVSENAIQAQVTNSVIGQKLGNFVGDGRIKSGKRIFDSLSIPDDIYKDLIIEPLAQLLDLNKLMLSLKMRKHDAHKGDFGHVMVVGGDHGYGGAPLMAAQMAARSGAGLVSVATQVNNTSAINARQPEIMAVGVASGQVFLPFLDKPDVIVVGPGLGQTSWSEQLLYHCLHAKKSMVVDADALNILSQEKLMVPALEGEQVRPWILTPHPGEAARLLGMTIDEVQHNRVHAIHLLQQKFGGAVVLKGAGTLVLTSQLKLYVCDAGNPSMASGGMGDVLSGLLGALMAQGLSIDDAACLGTVLHSRAADSIVSEEGPYGLLATDLIGSVRRLLNSHFKGQI